jgi:hypothetical protein
VLAYANLTAAGAKPFSTAPDSNFPAVLKALQLQREFAAILKPLFTRPGLRRAAGQIDTGKPRFPKHFVVERE